MNTRPSARRSLPLWLGVLLSALLSALAACSDSPPPAPVINAQPTDTSATAGSAATLSVGASGPDLAYQRQQSTDAGSTWTNIAGATQANHATAAITPADSGKRFRAVSSNASGHANSNAALLTVSAAAPAPSGSGKLAAAFRHTCAIKSDATLNCWGYNSSAQLGSGDRNRYWAPNPVAGLTGVTAVATGSNDTGAIQGGGNLSCWGNTSVLLPVAVAGYTGVQAVAVGATHKCFITAAGNVRCAGNNSAGQLGDGTNSSSPTPVLVIAAANGANIGNVVALAAGSFHTCALRSDRSLVCWGSNNEGQLGSGDLATRTPPTAVRGGASFAGA